MVRLRHFIRLRVGALQAIGASKINTYACAVKEIMTTNLDKKSDNTPHNNVAWEDLFLTPLNESDLDSLYVWQNCPSLRDLTMGFRFPIQMETVKEWMRDIREENSKSRVIYAIRVKNELVGTVSLHSIDRFQRKSLFGIYIGNHNQRAKGVGFISTCLILDYAFNGLDFRKVSLEVIEKNPTAIALYERIGFKKEGTKRKEYYIDGDYIDTHIYSMLKNEFNIKLPERANRLLHTLHLK